jgi:hypothetical protein
LKLGRTLRDDEEARHLVCDNPPCVNGAHLAPGTRRDNAQDMASRGRAFAQRHPERAARGEASAVARLTTAQVIEIRTRHGRGEAQNALAAAFHIGTSQVNRIVHGSAWVHVQEGAI